MVTWQSWHFADDGEGHDWPEHFFFFFHEFRIKNARDTSKRQSNGVMKQAQETGMNDAARRVRDRKQRGREGAHTPKRVCEIEGRRKKVSPGTRKVRWSRSYARMEAVESRRRLIVVVLSIASGSC